nr:Deoxycytidine monophosphate (dCMP) deaminase [Polyrhizophydium stewartii]
MLVGVVGPVCAGKSEVVRYLVERHGFTQLCVVGAATAVNGSAAHEADLVDASSLTPGTVSELDGSDETDVAALARRAQDAFGGTRTFATIAELCDYATHHWRGRHVVNRIDTIPRWDVVRKRPFFLLVGVEAPSSVRLQRWLARQKQQQQTSDGAAGAAAFLRLEDERMFSTGGSGQSLHSVLTGCHVRIINGGGDGQTDGLQGLHATIERAGLLDAGRTRPSWDAYFMSLCDLAAQRSNCMKLHEVVYAQEYGMDSMTAALLREGGVHLRQFSQAETYFST